MRQFNEEELLEFDSFENNASGESDPEIRKFTDNEQSEFDRVDTQASLANNAIYAKTLEGVDEQSHIKVYDVAKENDVDTTTILNAPEEFEKPPFQFSRVGKVTEKFLSDKRGNAIYSKAQQFNDLEDQYRIKQQRAMASHASSFGTGDNLSFAQLGIHQAKLQRAKIQPLKNQFWGDGSAEDKAAINNSNTQLSMLREPEGLFEDIVAASSGELYDLGADIEQAKYGLALAAGIKIFTPAGKAWSVLSTVAGAGSMTAVGAEQEMLYFYEELSGMKDRKGKVLDNDIARGVSAFYGLTSGMLENIPALRSFGRAVPEVNIFGKFTKKQFKDKLKQPSVRAAFKRFGKNFTRGMTEESFTEIVQQLTKDLSKNAMMASTGNEYDWKEEDFTSLSKLADNMGKAGIEALKGSVGIHGAISTGGLKRDLRLARESQERLDAKQAIFDAINDEAIKNTGTVGKEFSKEAAVDTGGQGNFIDPDIVETFFQNSDLTNDDIEKNFPLTAQAIYEAKEADDGREINIPDHEFTQFSESAAASDIMNNYRDSFESLTRAEAIQLNKEIDESLKQEPGQLPEYEQFYDQFKQSGATDYVARKLAMVWQARVKSRAFQKGISPEELLQDMELKIDFEAENQQEQYERIDSLLDQIRSGQTVTNKQAYGESVIEFLANEGGLIDNGGELSDRDLNKGQRGKKKLPQESGITFDEAIERLVENGYFLDETSAYTQQDVLDAIDSELSGQPVYSEVRGDPVARDLKAETDQLEDELSRLGIDVATASNADVKSVMESDALYQTEDGFVLSSNNEINMGHIDTETAKLIGREAGNIRLEVGIHNDDDSGRGLKHIQVRHGKEIQSSGYASVQGFVEDVAKNYSEVRKASGGALLLVKKDKGNVLIVRLQPSDNGSFYTVETALPMRINRIEKKYPLLGVRSESPTIAPSGQSASVQMKVTESDPTMPHANSNQEKDNLNIYKSIGKRNTQKGKGFKQDDPKGYKGKYTRDPLGKVFALTFTGKADLSTYIHESGHAFLDMLIQDAQSEPEQQKELDAVMKWMGVDDVSQIENKQHEQFARGFEAYLREGKSPSADLKEIFKAFHIWLKQIYKTMRRLDVELTDEVISVMDRMLATEQEIEQARNDSGILPVFDDLSQAEKAGMNTEDYEAYRVKYNDMMQEYERQVEAEHIKEFNKQQAFVTKERTDKARVQAEENLKNEYDIYHFIKNGTFLTDRDIDDFYLVDGKARKLTKDSVQRTFPKIPANRMRNTYTLQDTGIDADVMANAFNMSGVELVEMLANKVPYKEAIQRETTRLLMDEYGEVEPIVKPQDVVHGDPTGTFIEGELKALGSRTALVVGVKNKAKTTIRAMKIVDVMPITYQRAERKASIESARALAKGDKRAAALAKQRQLLNHHLYKEASSARNAVDKQLRYLKTMEKKPARQRLGKAGEDYLNAVDDILIRMDLKQVSNKFLRKKDNLREYIRLMKEDAVPFDESLEQRILVKNYKELSVEDFEYNYEAVKSIAHAARIKNKWLSSKDKRDFKEVKEGVINSIFSSKEEKKVQPVDKKKVLGKLMHWIKEADMSLVKAEFLLRWLDGGEVAGYIHQQLFQPIADAEAMEMEMAQEYTEQLMEKLSGHKDWHKTVKFMGKEYQKSQVIAVALNLGNEGNLQRLLDGYNWQYDSVIRELSALFTKEDWDAVQGVWDVIDGLYKPMSDVSQRAEGIRPEKVESRAFTLSSGRKMRGGYYPAVYDPEKSSIGEGQDSQVGGVEGFLSTSVSGTAAKQRAKKVNDPLSLELSVLTNHISETIRYITHYEAVKNNWRIINNSEVREAISATWGEEYRKGLKHWLETIANNGQRDKDKLFVDGMMRYVRQGTSIAAMGYSISTGLIQPMGLLTSMHELGGQAVIKGLMQFMKNPVKIWKSLNKTYPEFKHLANMYDRDLKKQMAHDWDQSKIAVLHDKWFKDFAFAHIAAIQKAVNAVTYLAAIEKYSKEDGITIEQAKKKAESVVRTTQSMSGTKDMAKIQTIERFKLLTMFYSYFSAMYGQVRSPKDAKSLASMATFIIVLPSILDTLFRGSCEGEDKEAFCYLRNTALYATATIPFARDAAAGVMGDYGYSISPVGSTIGRLINAGKDGELNKRDLTALAPLVHLPKKLFTQTYDIFLNEDVDTPREYIYGEKK